MNLCFQRIQETVGHQTQARSERSRNSTQPTHPRIKPPPQETSVAAVGSITPKTGYSSSSSAACSPWWAPALTGAFAFLRVQYPTNNITTSE